MKEEICELLAIADSTIYKFRKEKRPIITFLEKYFTKEDLEEFLEYGTVEKLEFANIQNYGNRVAEFVKLLYKLQDFLYQDYINVTHTSYLEKKDDITDIETLDRSLDLHTYIEDNIKKITKVENEGLSYLALVFATDPLKSSENSEDFAVDNLSKLILHKYDEFKSLQSNDSWIDSVLLGNFLDAFRKEYPKYSDYNQILFRMAQNDFIPFVKLCAKYNPRHIKTAMWFCVKFNIYKYQSKADVEEIFERIPKGEFTLRKNGKFTSLSSPFEELPEADFEFDFEKFKNEIQKIKLTNY